MSAVSNPASSQGTRVNAQINELGIAFAPYDRVALLPEAAAILGVSTWTLKRLAKQEKITILRLSPRRLGIRLSELERYLAITAKAAA